MPIYAYRCSRCGHAQDVLQKISDPLLTRCPSCGEESFVKQVTAAGFQLKGSGWYVTDFRGGNNGAAKDKAEGDGSGGKADEKAADKAADKAAEKAAGPAAEKSGEKSGEKASAPAPAPAAAAPAGSPAAAPAAAPGKTG